VRSRRRPASRASRPRPDAEIVGGQVSWRSLLGIAEDKTPSRRVRLSNDAVVLVLLFEMCPPPASVLPIANNEKFGTFSFYEQLSGKLRDLPAWNIQRLGSTR
jgi:hypothetical protein